MNKWLKEYYPDIEDVLNINYILAGMPNELKGQVKTIVTNSYIIFLKEKIEVGRIRLDRIENISHTFVQGRSTSYRIKIGWINRNDIKQESLFQILLANSEERTIDTCNKLRNYIKPIKQLTDQDKKEEETLEHLHKEGIQKQRRLMRNGLIIVMGIIAAFIIFFYVDPFRWDRAVIKKNTTEIVRNSEWDASVSQVKNYLLSNLKDPDSYQPVEWSEVQKVNMPQWKYIVRHKYRAKNSFGGYIAENQMFYLDKEGVVVKVVSR